ncbi:MAG TPA: VOC family protein [Rhodothermales bacterium]|jgi:catechol 2,3-dioxygenase-like lactoylglutathione lyase family enzyme
MIRFDHLAIPVSDHARSRDWYSRNFGFKVEFEIPERRTVALQDDGDFTLFLFESVGEVAPSCTLTFQVDDVESKYRELSEQGVRFEKAPQRLFWGYGAELRDPDGYLINVWDERSMREKGGG